MLAYNFGELTLSLVKRSGRICGYEDSEQEQIKKTVIEVLKKVGIPESEFPKLLREWNRFIEFDYSRAILGGHRIPEMPTMRFSTNGRLCGEAASIMYPAQTKFGNF